MWTRLHLTVLHAEYRSELDAQLPEYKGSLLRGALGHSLKALSCVQPEDGEACAACSRPDRCAGGAMFDPVGPGPDGSEPHDRPAPFVLTPPGDRRVRFRAGDRLGLTLTLVGSGRVWLPWVIAALADLGWNGLGVERKPWSLAGLWSEGPVGVRTPIDVGSAGVGGRIPELAAAELVSALSRPDSGAARIHFLTPAYLQREKRLVTEVDGPLLLSRLFRRLGSLLEHYERWEPAGFDFRSLIDLSARIGVAEQRLDRLVIERYSNRQGRKHELSGLVGSVTLTDIPPEIWPYLVVGQRIHIGKGATFGQGHYLLEPLTVLSPSHPSPPTMMIQPGDEPRPIGLPIS